MSITIYRGSDTVTFPDPDFNDEEDASLNQVWGETDGGSYFFENPDYKTIRYRWSFVGVKDTHKVDLETFIDDVIQGGAYTFSISRSNPASYIQEVIYPYFIGYGLAWKIYPGCSLGGPQIYPGFEYGAATLYYHNLRHIDEGYSWRQIREGWWDLIWTFVKEPD